MSAVVSWKTGTHNIIQVKSLFTHVLSNIYGYSYIKANEEKVSMAEEDLNNDIILDSGFSIDIFNNTQLVVDIKRTNQVFHLSTNVRSKINQIQEMVPDYGKLWYDDKSIANIFSITIFFKKYIFTYESYQDDTFTVHNNRGIVKLRINKQGLYVFKSTYTTENSNLVTAVE